MKIQDYLQDMQDEFDDSDCGYYLKTHLDSDPRVAVEEAREHEERQEATEQEYLNSI